MSPNISSDKKIPLLMLVSACITGLIVLAVFMICGNMGFGSSSLTIMDGEVQYVDLFNYLKDVLTGADSFAYSFNKGLGGTGVAILAYYLASPLNLIVLLIPKASMPLVTDILFMMKVILASAFAALALAKRFPHLGKLFLIILSVGYSLMHWNLVQSSNIMWLDGVYMLPLVMLSVYELVRRKNLIWLSLTLGLSIIFNWYTGAFNCIFAVVWFVAEILIMQMESKDPEKVKNVSLKRSKSEEEKAGTGEITETSVKHGKTSGADTGGLIIRFTVGIILAISLSMVLFLPNFLALRAGKGSAFDLHSLIGGFISNPLNIIRNNTAGVFNFYGLSSASVFCGSLVTVTCITIFRSAYFRLKEKIFTAVIMFCGLATFFFKPFYYIMCLLRSVESYEFRHEYLITMMFVFLAGWYLERAGCAGYAAAGICHKGTEARKFRREMGRLFQNAVVAAAAIVLLAIVFPTADRDNTGIIVTAAALVITGLFIYVSACSYAQAGSDLAANEMSTAHTVKHHSMSACSRAAAVIIIAAVFAELFWNCFAIVRVYNNDNDIAAMYGSYAAQMEEFRSDLAKLLAADSLQGEMPGPYETAEAGDKSAGSGADAALLTGNYRLTATGHRKCGESGEKATLNDGLAFNLMTNATYSSCTENVQVQLMDRLGYKEWAGVLNVVDTSIIPSDSLLAVRYVLSDEPIAGLNELEGWEAAGRRLYENPYALPFAYTVHSSSSVSTDQAEKVSTFEYVNSLYRELTGDPDLSIFIPVNAQSVVSEYDPGRCAYETIMQITDNDEDFPVYMEIADSTLSAVVYVNEIEKTQAGKWLSDSVIYIPQSSVITIISDEKPDEDDFLIYAADLNALGAVADTIRADNTVSGLQIHNGSVTASAYADGNTYLQTSVMATDGWTVLVNGKKTAYEIFADSMIRIPLEEGENDIAMLYEVPGLAAGKQCSEIAIALLVIIAAVMIYRSRRTSKPSDE